jgi:hypothetical protein
VYVASLVYLWRKRTQLGEAEIVWTILMSADEIGRVLTPEDQICSWSVVHNFTDLRKGHLLTEGKMPA